MKFFQEDYIKNLPDCYNKDPTSNNYKILQLLKYDAEKFQSTLQELWDCLDLDKAAGHTLAMYGDMVGQSRGLASDEQFKILIKTKIARNRCESNYKSVIDCICRVLDCQPSEMLIEELDAPCSVRLVDVPLDKIIGADLTPNQFSQIVATLLPAGVSLEIGSFSGTLVFSDEEMEASRDTGFCQNEGDNYGGTFGLLGDEGDSAVLPI